MQNFRVSTNLIPRAFHLKMGGEKPWERGWVSTFPRPPAYKQEVILVLLLTETKLLCRLSFYCWSFFLVGFYNHKGCHIHSVVIQTITSIWRENVFGYYSFVRGHCLFREANSSPGAKLKDRKKTVYVASQLRAESLPVSTSGWVSELGRRKWDGWKLFQICARHPGANSTKLGAQTKLSAAVYADVKPINLGRKTNRYVNLLLSLLK